MEISTQFVKVTLSLNLCTMIVHLVLIEKVENNAVLAVLRDPERKTNHGGRHLFMHLSFCFAVIEKYPRSVPELFINSNLNRVDFLRAYAFNNAPRKTLYKQDFRFLGATIQGVEVHNINF